MHVRQIRENLEHDNYRLFSYNFWLEEIALHSTWIENKYESRVINIEDLQ